MFRQPPRIEDISHRRVWEQWRMTGIFEKLYWLCVCCSRPAALVSGMQLNLKVCCPTWLGVFLCVLRVTGAHLFKVAVEAYHAPAVSAAVSAPHHDISVFIEENKHYILGQNSRKHDMGNGARGFFGRFLVLSLFCLQRQTGFSAK